MEMLDRPAYTGRLAGALDRSVPVVDGAARR